MRIALKSLLLLPETPGSGDWARTRLVMGWGLAFMMVALFFSYAFLRLDYGWNWSSIWDYRQKFWQGWLLTVGLSLTSLLVSVFLGLLLALASSARLVVLRCLARIYVELIRGTPLLVQILIFYYVVAPVYGIQGRFVSGVLILSIFSSAYLAEIFRAGMENIAGSQLESSRAVGFTRWQTYRYVIFPQALRQTLPPLAGQFANLIKDSSLLSIIAISEFTLAAQEVNSMTFSAFESFLPLAIGYLMLTLPLSLWSRRLENRLRYDH